MDEAYLNPEVQGWFHTVDQDHSGQINWKELQNALVNGQGNSFSESACKLMIGLFARDGRGTVDAVEFQQLFHFVNQWVRVFQNFDKDQSGYIEEDELANAFGEMGYRLTASFAKFLIGKLDIENHQHISLDQFIVICVQIHKLTDAFRMRDPESKGMIQIGFEEFLTVAIDCLT